MNLSRIGFRPNDIRGFQQAYALGRPLAVDGIAGPLTRAAIDTCLAADGRISAHFHAREFACRCGGRQPGCKRVVVHRGLLLALEAYRDLGTSPLALRSGYRCPRHNRAVGGASASMHRVGWAADVPGRYTVAEVRALGAFSGIGYSRSTGRVLHVDTRHLAGRFNLTGATLTRPTIWTYA